MSRLFPIWEAAALMESLGNNHGFIDGNKRIAFTAANVFLRRNGFYIEVEALEGYQFIYGSMDPAGIPLPENPGLDPAAHQAGSLGILGSETCAVIPTPSEVQGRNLLLPKWGQPPPAV